MKNGIPSHDTFSRLFANLVPAGLQKALLCLTQDWADELGDVVAVDGKALRRRSRTPPKVADGAASIDARYYLLRAEFSAERLGRIVRSDWAIENADARIGRLHWVLDVSMDEDQARNHKGNSAACLAVVRRLALNIARMHPDNDPFAASSSTPSAATTFCWT